MSTRQALGIFRNQILWHNPVLRWCWWARMFVCTLCNGFVLTSWAEAWRYFFREILLVPKFGSNLEPPMLGATTWISMSWNPRPNMCYIFFRDAVWWLRHCHLLHSACKFKFLQFGTCVPVRISSWWFTSASGDRILNAIRLHKRVNSVHFECSQLKSHCLAAGSAAERRLFVLAERVVRNGLSGPFDVAFKGEKFENL